MRSAAGWVAAFVLLAALPAVVANPYARHVVLVALIFAFVALGLNLVFGYAGQHAFGHPVFFGVGAYASALLALRAGLPTALAVVAGALVTAAIALAVGYPSFRLRGIYFGMVTFAFARVIYVVAQNWIGLTRGPMGIPGVPPLEGLGAGRALGLGAEPTLHVILVAALAGTVFLLHRLVRSDIGRSWIAIRENEELAASVGIAPLRYKMGAFAGGAALAAVGGGLYAHYVSFISPTELGFHYIGIVFIMVIAGGTATLAGPLLGAVVFGVLPEVLRVAETARNLLLGAILLLTIAFLPEGLVGLWARIRTARRAARPAVASAVARAVGPDGARPLAAARAASGEAGVLEIRGLTKRFGGLVVLREVSFEVRPGEIVALIGPNGAGKTTLFNIVTGLVPPTAGEVTYRGVAVVGAAPAAIAALGIARTFQITSLFPELTVEDNIRTAAHLWAERRVLPALVRTRGFRAREAEIDAVVEEILDLVRLRPQRATAARALSYGEQRGLEVALALATRCRLLLLDEPAAGLNPEETGRLSELILGLRRRGLTVLLIEHDMHLVMGLSDRVVVLDSGEKIAEGTPREVVADARVVEAYLGTEARHA